MTVFHWPQKATVLESTLPTTLNGLSSDLEDKLKDLGIFRAGGDDDGSQVEGAARRCGVELIKRQDNNNNNNKKMTEPVLWHDKKEGKEKKTTRPRSTENNKGPIRTGGWSNPAWKIVQPQPNPALVRAF